MSSSSLENKTIRPGSFVGYSYYHSLRRPESTEALKPPKSRSLSLLLVVILVIIGVIGLNLLLSSPKSVKSGTGSTSPASSSSAPAVISTMGSNNPCTGNSLSQLIKVSINARHLWACQNQKLLFNSPVVTGMAAHVDTITPIGTYQIYAKETDLTLTGSDSTGSWSDPVSYWMPFLDNQYGTYGLHDATWRSNSQFGNIPASSSNASHGCVELPLSTAKWLYNWSEVGTTVSVVN